ncbi:MAG: SufD family Fe-S cluster assembly protein [Bacilli bacterium]|jgi:Fe-S cluster assembly protein SufD|nr:SufD family Fe-S cluster assembly protein [Bacilli bacterium]MCH4210841.1 SufD family Fe-S cluster assembly protein [Bacilli bacterium]MCH4228935.1 SufD family Fe-S cluster assembly protein [Bacilli bacterium]MCH4277755.1 SufD family Fe-S cluster assembly protein [Bacilli bacterium]MCI2055001.1 SufD family Fe-S cluster assembly protein [Bacilli bacterium]
MIKNSQKDNTSFALYVDEDLQKVTYDVKKGESFHLDIASFKANKDIDITVNVYDDASFEGAFADFSPSSFTFILNVNLLGRGSKCLFHGVSIASKGAIKKFYPSVNHSSIETEALMSNYGIVRDDSRLVFSGVSHIDKGAKKAATRQEAKIIVFDKSGDAQASPILKIDDNDVQASHAAVVGRLNEDHLFYLESRGVNEEEAKRLITLGYLKPIEQYFNDDSINSKIDQAIEEGV